jgi:hypothetical protein
MPKKCSVNDCERDAKERGWCHGHYQRWKRTGDVNETRPLGRKTQGRCQVEVAIARFMPAVCVRLTTAAS